MASITDVRTSLAELVRAALDLDYGLPRCPSPIRPLGVFVIPQPAIDYISWDDGGGFTTQKIALSAIVVGPTANIDVAAEWLDGKLEIIRSGAFIDANPTLSGKVSDLVVKRVAEPGMLTVEGGGTAYSAEVAFHPFYVSAT